MTVEIHPTAVISDGAHIGEGSTVGPYSCIGAHVVLGKNNRIGPHVVLEGRTRIGDGNTIFQFASIGAVPQDLKFSNEPSELHIGNGNTIREYVTLQPGTEGGGMLTSIGNENLFMVSAHVGHDCHIGNRNIIANGSAIAGHVTIGSYVTVGGLSAIHQFTRIGDYAFLGGGAMVVKDIPPYCIAQGDRAGLVGLNEVGLRRHGFTEESIQSLYRAYRKLFISPGKFSDKLQVLFDECLQSSASEQAVTLPFLEFLKASQRGLTLARSSKKDGDKAEEN